MKSNLNKDNQRQPPPRRHTRTTGERETNLNRKPTLFNFCGVAANTPRCRHPRRPARHAGGGWAARVARSNGACQNSPIPAPNRGARRDRLNTGSGDPQPRWPWTRKPETARLSRANGRERGRTEPVFFTSGGVSRGGGEGYAPGTPPTPRRSRGPGPTPREEARTVDWPKPEQRGDDGGT